MSLADSPPPSASVDPAEVEKFSRIAAQWWDPRGKFAPLHRFNPVRLGFIRDQATRRFGRHATSDTPFSGLRLLDVGCGGGLLSEPMTRLGFQVTGIDASTKNIGVASAHAAEVGLEIDYRCTTVEDLLASGEPPFDVVLNMEVVEHVADPGRFLRESSRLVAPGGLMVVATLNRTLKALALAKIGAEYVLRWLPAGSHDWRRFLTPDEVRLFLSPEPLAVEGPVGVVYNPLADRWSLSADTSVNYMMTAARGVRRALLLAFGATLAAAGAARAQTSPILPGYWDSDEHYSVLLSGGGRSRKCLTAAEVAQFIQAPQTSHYHCRYASREVGDGHARFRGGACYNKHGRLTLSNVSVEGDYAPDSFHLDFSFGLNLSSGLALPGTAHIDAHRLSAQCPADPAAAG